MNVEHLFTCLILCGIFYNDFKTSVITILLISMGGMISHHTIKPL